jgi:hypothetical protein
VAQTLTFGESGFTITNDSRPGTEKLVAREIDGVVVGANRDDTTIAGLQVVGTSRANHLELSSKDEVATVSRLEAQFLAGNDSLLIIGNIQNSDIRMADGNDRFTADGQIRPTTSLNTGAGNDIARINSTTSGSSIAMGTGDDLLIFGGVVRDSSISLGTGADEVRFNNNALNSSVNLGGDTDKDIVRLSANGVYTGLRISGADSSDVLFIGSSEYAYRSARNEWVNVNDRNDVRTFNG